MDHTSWIQAFIYVKELKLPPASSTALGPEGPPSIQPCSPSWSTAQSQSVPVCSSLQPTSSLPQPHSAIVHPMHHPAFLPTCPPQHLPPIIPPRPLASKLDDDDDDDVDEFGYVILCNTGK